ncbi:MAG: class I SAM-dependent RNA methyltransferase [Gemmatimonadaceae bacterium]
MSGLVDVEIESIAAGGDGVARVAEPDGGALVAFLPRTAPADAGRARLQRKGRFARGELVELTRPSPDRVAPPCPHYTRDRCGGCQLQHLRYPAQLDAKGGIIADALRRIGRRDVGRPAVAPSAREWRYRRKLTLALRRAGGRWIAGLHPYDAPGRVFELADCPITDERVVAAWREIMAAQRFFPRAAELRGAVRLLGDGVSFVLEGGTVWSTARQLFDAVQSIEALWWEPEGRRRVLLHDRRRESSPGASFVQVNAEVAGRLWAAVEERVLALRPATVVDAYSGAGDTAVRLSEQGVRVTAIEADREAAHWCAARLAAGSRSVAARVEDALGDALPADVVIVNPPRTGLHERVPETLAAGAPAVVIYVSCNPATLARDVARLAGYRVESLRAFDMFPQTAHVETVCELVREAA